MSKLENNNLHEHIIRSSITVLIFKGGIAWALLALMDYMADQAPTILNWLTDHNLYSFVLNPESLINFQSLFHLSLNILYGALLLYIIMSWVYEYYVIKDTAILVHHGIIFSRENVYQMEDVKTIEVYQGFWGKLLNMGTVSFFAYRAQKHIRLSNIDQPRLIAEHIQSLHPTPDILPLITTKKINT